MKNTSKIILRSLAATPLKVAIVYAGIIALLYLDLKPLPDWTADALAYFIHFAAAYFLAWWVLDRRSGRWLDGVVVAFNFIVVGGLIELFVAGLLRGPSAALIQHFFTWQSASINLAYLIGVLCAFWQVRVKKEKLEASI